MCNTSVTALFGVTTTWQKQTQIFSETSASMPAIIATQEVEIRRIEVWSQPWKIVHKTLSWKYPTQKRAGRVAQVVECLPSQCKALSSNPSNTKKGLFWGTHFNTDFKDVSQRKWWRTWAHSLKFPNTQGNKPPLVKVIRNNTSIDYLHKNQNVVIISISVC
jgi:hypothetical protein